MKSRKILSVSAPGGDRGPAVGYRNHLKALSGGDFQISEISQEIWESDNLMKQFDCAWAYVRFDPRILFRCESLGIPVIGGPNIAMERADLGISDQWEKWYLEESNVRVNLNVADYYTDRVRSFVKSGMQCRTLEYCYEADFGEVPDDSVRKNDVLVYVKNRVNDRDASAIAENFCSLLRKEGLSYKIIEYGSYEREDYLRDCKSSKVVAWISIEDYCSLAQIEAHLSGCCVVGTQYNLTIPTDPVNLSLNAQIIHGWVSWKSPEVVAQDYLEATMRTLQIKNLSKLTLDTCKQRHSYSYYRSNVEKIISSLE